MKHAFITLLAIVTLVAPALAAENEKMVTRTYDVVASFMERKRSMEEEMSAMGIKRPQGGEFQGMGPGGTGTSKRGQDQLKKFFSAMGVTWPKGSFVRHVPSIGKIIARNTPENMEKFEAALELLNVKPSQIEIEAHFVEFSMKDIDELSREGMISVEGLNKLRRKGKAKLLAAPKVITQSGQEATVKGVSEVIYPTEFDVEQTVVTNKAGDVKVTGIAVEPGSFETREVGTIFSVMPEVSPEGNMINLTMTPEHVLEPRWIDYGGKYKDAKGKERHAKMEQPIFHSYTVTTQIAIRNGATVLTTGGMNSRDGKHVVYIYTTARLIGIDGVPIRRRK